MEFLNRMWLFKIISFCTISFFISTCQLFANHITLSSLLENGMNQQIKHNVITLHLNLKNRLVVESPDVQLSIKYYIDLPQGNQNLQFFDVNIEQMILTYTAKNQQSTILLEGQEINKFFKERDVNQRMFYGLIKILFLNSSNDFKKVLEDFYPPFATNSHKFNEEKKVLYETLDKQAISIMESRKVDDKENYQKFLAEFKNTLNNPTIIQSSLMHDPSVRFIKNGIETYIYAHLEQMDFYFDAKNHSLINIKIHQDKGGEQYMFSSQLNEVKNYTYPAKMTYKFSDTEIWDIDFLNISYELYGKVSYSKFLDNNRKDVQHKDFNEAKNLLGPFFPKNVL